MTTKQDDVKTRIMIERICGDGPFDECGSRCFLVEELDRREDAHVALWRHLPPTNLPACRHFVSCGTELLFEVDFLSRHEIVKPYSPENMPQGWQDWAIREGNSLMVHNQARFRERLLTPDLFLALPKHRFGSLADDVASVAEEKHLPPGKALLETLLSQSVGYSFVLFVYNDGEMRPCLVHSVLEGARYEHRSLFRLAFEQLELRSA